MSGEEATMDSEIRELVTTKGLAVVYALAKQFATGSDIGFNESDFVDMGTEMLLRVAPDYDRERKAKFTTYITPYVKGVMLDAVRHKHLELTVQELIGQTIDRDARGFSSRQSDEFEIVFDPVEANQARLDANLSDMALGLVATTAATAIRLKRRGTEDHLGDLEEHAIIAGLIADTVAGLPEAIQRLWEVHYVEERPLTEYMAELGISEATAGRHHRALKDELREVLLAARIEGLPDVD
jgi:RNA polymerase sigma factor (sigma-70 family)